MQSRRSTGGYTIIEVMIFLAVSAFMFILAAAFIQGKQQAAQFNQGMNSINSVVQQTISDIGDNNYLPTQITCTATPSGNLIFQNSGGNQGQNYDCTSLGKVIQFDVANTNGQGFNIYTLAGCHYAKCQPDRTDPLETPSPNSFSQAAPTVIDPADPAVNDCTPRGNQVNLTVCDRLKWGLQATAMYDDSTGTPIPTNSIGIFNSFIEANGEGLVSGAQYEQAVDTGFNGVNFSSNVTESQMARLLNGNMSSATPIVDPYFVVCFKDGAGHAGALTIGGPNTTGSLTTSIQTSDSGIELFNNSGFVCKT